MKKNIFVGLVAALAMCAFVATGMVSAGDEVEFAYKYTEGSSQSYQIKFNQEADFGQFSMSALVDMEITENCTKATDSTYTLEWTFDKVDASRVMFENMQTDPMTDNLVGQKVTFDVDPTGEVTDVKPVSYIEGWEQAQETVSRIIESSFPTLPNKGVAVGGDWDENETETTDEGTEVTSSGKYHYKENKTEGGRDCAFVEGEVEMTIGGKVAGPQGEMDSDGDGKGEFEMFFDSKAGVVVKLKGKIEINMTLSPTGGGDSVETSVGFETEKKLK